MCGVCGVGFTTFKPIKLQPTAIKIRHQGEGPLYEDLRHGLPFERFLCSGSFAIWPAADPKLGSCQVHLGEVSLGGGSLWFRKNLKADHRLTIGRSPIPHAGGKAKVSDRSSTPSVVVWTACTRLAIYMGTWNRTTSCLRPQMLMDVPPVSEMISEFSQEIYNAIGESVISLFFCQKITQIQGIQLADFGLSKKIGEFTPKFPSRFIYAVTMNLLQCLEKSRICSMCQHGNLMEDVWNGTSKQTLAWMSVPLPFWCTIFSGKECQRFRRSWGGEPVALWGPSGCSRCPKTAQKARWHESIWVWTSCTF